MGDVVNLRKARKQAKRAEDARQAESNRLAYGRPKSERGLTEARTAQVRRALEGHRIEQGDEQ